MALRDSLAMDLSLSLSLKFLLVRAIVKRCPWRPSSINIKCGTSTLIPPCFSHNEDYSLFSTLVHPRYLFTFNSLHSLHFRLTSPLSFTSCSLHSLDFLISIFFVFCFLCSLFSLPSHNIYLTKYSIYHSTHANHNNCPLNSTSLLLTKAYQLYSYIFVFFPLS